MTTSLADHHCDGECTAEPRTNNFSGLTYELVAKMGLDEHVLIRGWGSIHQPVIPLRIPLM